MKTILKIPFDLGTIGEERRGSAKAPEVVQGFVGNVKDAIWKEIEVTSDFEHTSDKITSAALEAYEKGQVIGLGGDHSIAYGLMRAFSHKFKGGLIFFDAHLDCEDDFLPPSHEDLIKAVVNEGFFAPEDILIIGARKFYPKEIEFVKKKNIRLGKLEDITEFIKDKENLYISVDIDVFDPEFAPGTGYPEKHGLNPEKVIPVIKELVNSGKVKGFDLVEINPKKDINNTTSKLAAKLLMVFLGAN